MSFVEVTIVSHDALNGEKILIRADDIRQIITKKIYKEKIPLIGEKPKICSLLSLAGGQYQTVAEAPESIRKMIEVD